MDFAPQKKEFFHSFLPLYNMLLLINHLDVALYVGILKRYQSPERS